MDSIEYEVTILEKDGNLGAVGKQIFTGAAVGLPEGIVGNYDSRTKGAAFRRPVETAELTNAEYRKAINTTLARGWKAVYRGRQLNEVGLS